MAKLEFGQEGVGFGGDLGQAQQRGMIGESQRDLAEANGLKLPQNAGDFAGFAAGTPLAAQAGADPIGQKANANVGDDTAGLVVEDGAHFEIALEFAESFLDFQEVFIMPLHTSSVGLVRGKVGVQQIPSVV